MSTFRIRAARPVDKRGVRSLLSRIWEDDYVLDVFDVWVRDRRGRLWVAVVDGKVAGVAKLTLLGDGEAWLHALRVDPRYRRRGIATALLEHRLRRARRLGARVARLDTSEDNVAVHRMAARHAFRRLGRYGYFGLLARDIDPPRRAKRGELDVLWRLAREGDGLLHETYTARRVARQDIARAVRGGLCMVADARGESRAMAIVEPEGERLGVSHLAGRGRAAVALLRALAGEAKRRRPRRVSIGLAGGRWRAAIAAGYRQRWHGAMLIFERKL